MKPGVRHLARVLYLFYLVILFVATALAAEFLLRRQEGRSAIYPISAGVFRDHQYYGHELVPGVTGTMDPHGRLNVDVRPFTVSSLGLRTTAPAAAAPTRTVLVLGDSQVFGYWQSDDQTIPSVMAAAASKRGESWEVLNGGVSGYGTINAYWLARRVLAARRVNAVVLVYYTGNDPENNAANHLLGADGAGRLSGRTDYDTLRTRFAPSPDTAFKPLVLADLDRQIAARNAKSWKHRVIWWLEYDLRSRLFSRLIAWYGAAPRQNIGIGTSDTPASDATAVVRSPRYDRREHSAMVALWPYQAAALDDLSALCAEAGVPLTVVTLPQFTEVLPEYVTAARDPGYADTYDLDKVSAGVCAHVARRQVACHDLAGLLRQQQDPRALYWAPVDQHLTPTGSALVGRRIVELLGVLP